MPNLNQRQERSMTMAALANRPETADHAAEARVSVTMGEDERKRVAAALGVREGSAAPDPRLTEAVTRVRELRRQLADERRRCAAFCEAFPDNLMARHIRKLILEGK